MFIPNPNVFYPGSEFFSIPDPGSKILSIFTQENGFLALGIWSGLFIPDRDPGFLSTPEPGSRGQKGTGSRIRNTADGYQYQLKRCRCWSLFQLPEILPWYQCCRSGMIFFRIRPEGSFGSGFGSYMNFFFISESVPASRVARQTCTSFLKLRRYIGFFRI